jgi:hypothetical protein
MPEVKKEERRISPAIAIIPIGLGLAAVVGLAAVAFAAPEEPPPPGFASLYGKVIDAVTGYPLPGVLVTLNGLEVYTDAAGNYSFEGVETGEYLLQFSKEGYETATY